MTRTILINLFAVVGFAALVWGAWMIYEPAAWMLGGALLLGSSVAAQLWPVPAAPVEESE